MAMSNRRSVQQLDERIAEIKRLANLHALARNPPGNQGLPEGSDPYFYGAVGVDGKPGILVGDQALQPPFAPLTGNGAVPIRYWRGTIQIQNDAPFVCTHVMATASLETEYSPTNQTRRSTNYTSFFSVNGLGGSRDVVNVRAPRMDIGFVEGASGRVLFQSNFYDPPNRIGELMPIDLFDVMREFNPRGFALATASTAYTAADTGHGPSTLFEVPDEEFLPKNGVVNVTLQSLGWYNNFNNTLGSYGRTTPRVFVTLLGYKVFED